MMLRWLQKTGHQPITLMGGGTTKVGDPSFRADERAAARADAQIAANIAGIRRVFASYLAYGDGPTDAMMLDNAEWLDGLNYLDFLRDIGRHFSVNRMLSFESVKSRLDRDQSLSFLEFNYMILQAYDFLELNRRHGCLLQMGGSDQWGNIVNGIDLTRRVAGAEVFGLTSPLLTTSDGRKMGKTAGGAVWLNADMLVALRVLAVLAQHHRRRRRAVPEALHRASRRRMRPPRRARRLGDQRRQDHARQRGHRALPRRRRPPASAEATARAVFEQGGVGDDLPTVTLARRRDPGGGISVVQLLVKSGLAGSGKDARRLIAEGGARLDDIALTDAGLHLGADDLAEPRKLSAGKKRHALVALARRSPRNPKAPLSRT